MFLKNVLHLACISILLASCDRSNRETATEESPAATTIEQPMILVEDEQINQANMSLWQNTYQSLENLQNQLNTFDLSVDKFLADPTAQNLALTQNHWSNTAVTSRSYLFAKKLSFLAPSNFEYIRQLNFKIDAYPIQPGFIDAFGEHKFSGIVNDIGMPITRESLNAQHGLTDASEVMLGLYALEYILFGEDGTRQAEDFVKIHTLNREHLDKGFQTTSELANNRRRDLLNLQTKIIQADTAELVNYWEINGSAHRQWHNVKPENKMQAVHLTFEQVITQLLLEIVALEQPPENPFESHVSPATQRFSNEDKLRWLRMSYRAVNNMRGYLTEEQQSQYDKYRDDIDKTLETPDALSDLPSLYSKTKSLLDVLTM